MPETNHQTIPSTFDEPIASLLRAALGMERELTEALPDLISETPDATLRKELEHHLQETREHVQNLEEVFRAFGQEPVAATDPVVALLRTEHRMLIQQAAGVQRMLAVVASAAAAEHLEIARYEVLRAMAESRGNSRAVELIVRTLDQDRLALKMIHESMHRLLARDGVEAELAEPAPHSLAYAVGPASGTRNRR